MFNEKLGGLEYSAFDSWRAGRISETDYQGIEVAEKTLLSAQTKLSMGLLRASDLASEILRTKGRVDLGRTFQVSSDSGAQRELTQQQREFNLLMKEVRGYYTAYAELVASFDKMSVPLGLKKSYNYMLDPKRHEIEKLGRLVS